MSFAKRFHHQYHDGSLISATTGPRRELSLTIRLDPVWNDGLDTECTIRFGAVKNFDEVEAFVRQIRPSDNPGAYLDAVIHLGWTAQGNVQLELAKYGYVEVLQPKVVEI